MKHLLALAFAGIFSCGLHAQIVDTTVCGILDNPQSFNGKIVRVKGTVSAGFDTFMIKGDGCDHKVSGIWLSYPEGTKAKSGPAAMVQIQAASNFTGDAPVVQQTPVTLDKKDKEFKQFDSLLSTPNKGNGMCLGCIRYEVSATLVGRLDGIESASLERDKAGKITGIGGFGNLNAYSARLVLQSVSDVTPKEIDYSKVIEASKGESNPSAGPIPSLVGGPGGIDTSDPFAAAYKAAASFGAGNSLGDRLERAAAAYGKPKENSGVAVSFGTMNEAAAKYDTKGTANSPDGLLFNCFFNKNRLSGDALARAVVHIGEHIADARNPEAGFESAGLYEFEYKGWVETVIDGISAGQKTLSAPGGYVLWNLAVPTADRDSSLNAALLEFLSKGELLTR
jgi:hypothetical protein